MSQEHIHLLAFDTQRGAIISSWALIESSIDRSNQYAWLYTRGGISKVVPVSLRRKIKLFEEIHTKLLPFEPLKDLATQLLEQVKRRLDDRHWMAHGYLQPSDCVTNESWTLGRHEFMSDGNLSYLERVFTQAELDSIRRELTNLAKEFNGYIHALLAQVEKHPVDDSSR